MEYRRICNVCGNVWCYTDQDMSNSKMDNISSAAAAIGGIASIFTGNLFAMALSSANMDRNPGGIDYTKCPHCHSTNTSLITNDEWQKLLSTPEMSNAVLPAKKPVEINSNATEESLVKRIKIFMDEGDWNSARAYCEHLLDANPENGDVYFLELLIDYQVSNGDALIDLGKAYADNRNYQKARRYGTAELNALLDYIENQIIINQREAEKANEYSAVISNYSAGGDSAFYKHILPRIEHFSGYKDADYYIEKCKEKIIQTEIAEKTAAEQAEAARLEAERKTEEKRIAQEKAKQIIKKALSIVIPVAVVVLIAIMVVTKFIIPNNNYNKAVALMESGDYGTAITMFEALDGYKDSESLIEECQYQIAKTIMESGEYEEAINAFEALDGYKDSEGLIKECQYQIAKTIMESGDYKVAISVFKALDDYKDSVDLIEECQYQIAKTIMESGNYIEAITIFNELGGYKDSDGLAAGISDKVYEIGNNYYYGKRVKLDYHEAVKIYRLAAEAGNADAQSSLGDCYKNGEGVILNYTEAVKWYRLAADQGLARAQRNLGVCYYNGDGVEQDYTEAVKWYRLAADQGEALAQSWLGYCYEHGEGVTKNYNKAVEYYILAARQGEEYAINNLKELGESWE